MARRSSRSRAAGRGGAGRRRRAGGLAGFGAARPLRVALWLVALAAGLSIGFETARLDQIVRARFEGRLFRVPSKVLSSPVVLASGLDAEQIDLPGTLARLGYREVEAEGPLPVGRYRRQDGRIHLHRRPFAHPTRPEPELEAELTLAGSRIEAIRDARGRDLGVLVLEPELVGAYYGPDRAQRELVGVAELPPHVIDAVLAVEDQRFFDHQGVDAVRILGALAANLRSGRVIQGGSTLTQQLVKNFFLTPERSLTRKLQEAWMSLIVEARYEKRAILEAYLNEIYLGQRGATAVHGVGEGSRLYFGKDARELSVAEAALLAATINSPNGRSPFRFPEEAGRRRDLVIDMMGEQGRLAPEVVVAAKAEPLGLAPLTPEPREARFFLDFVQRELPRFYAVDALATEGLRIYSTLDLQLQLLAARAVREGLEQLERDFPRLAQGPEPLQACLVALRPRTGEVLALVGGRDYGASQFDRCTQARRPVGSAFKPFVYAAALEPVVGGPEITLASWLDDSPLSVPTPSGPWQPANFDREFHGRIPVGDALARSLNVATARLGQQVGPQRIAEVARRLGIESPLPEVPSLSLGAADVAPIELAVAYATLASGGVRPGIRALEDVVDAGGARVERQPIRSERVLDPGTAFLVTHLLAGVVDRGTGRSLRAAGVRGPVAGKTGTTNDEYDTWFAGYTPELAVVVWVGFDVPRSLGLPASRVALPIWTQFVKGATGGLIPGRFEPPREVELVDVDPETGAVALADCPRHQAVWFVRGTAPRATCPDFDVAFPGTEGRVRDWFDRLTGDREDRGGEPRPRSWLRRIFRVGD